MGSRITDRTIIVVVVSLTLGCLEVAALVTGNDGAYLLPVSSFIAGLAGYEIKNIKG